MNKFRLYLAKLLAPKEFAELQRWNGYCQMYQQWLPEFPAAQKALLNLRSAVQTEPENLNNQSIHLPGPFGVIKLVEHLRYNYGENRDSNV